MKVALLGGDGFVGSNIREILDKEKINYIIVSRKTGTDLLNQESVNNFFSNIKPDMIINCAAHVGSLNYVTEQAADVITDNSKMILNLYNSVAKICPKAIIINPIANCIYPDNTNTFSEENIWNGLMHRSVISYGGSRRLLLIVSECFGMQHNIKTINLIVPNMYGPHDSTDPNKAHALNALISKFVKAKKDKQESVEIWGTGIAIREWLFARDFGRIISIIIKNPYILGLSEPINIAQNFGLSVRELINVIQSQFDFNGKIIFDKSKPDGAPRKVMDDKKFKKVFKDFEFTNLEEGIKETIKYYEMII